MRLHCTIRLIQGSPLRDIWDGVEDGSSSRARSHARTATNQTRSGGMATSSARALRRRRAPRSSAARRCVHRWAMVMLCSMGRAYISEGGGVGDGCAAEDWRITARRGPRRARGGGRIGRAQGDFQCALETRPCGPGPLRPSGAFRGIDIGFEELSVAPELGGLHAQAAHAAVAPLGFGASAGAAAVPPALWVTLAMTSKRVDAVSCGSRSISAARPLRSRRWRSSPRAPTPGGCRIHTLRGWWWCRTGDRNLSG